MRCTASYSTRALSTPALSAVTGWELTYNGINTEGLIRRTATLITLGRDLSQVAENHCKEWSACGSHKWKKCGVLFSRRKKAEVMGRVRTPTTPEVGKELLCRDVPLSVVPSHYGSRKWLCRQPIAHVPFYLNALRYCHCLKSDIKTERMGLAWECPTSPGIFPVYFLICCNTKNFSNYFHWEIQILGGIAPAYNN